MRTLVAHDGKTVMLSDKVYRITESIDTGVSGGSNGYNAGNFVRLISGIEGSTTPGHHFNPDYLTVCRIGAKTAEFIGIRKIHLKDASNDPIRGY